MKYRVKRGRPRQIHPKKDLGTPELAAKRQAGLTIEPLDLCLQRGIISIDEHEAGIHFRWLYTVIFGVPNPSISNPGYLGGKSLREDNPAWLRDREYEYASAKTTLQRLKATPMVPNVCIFSRYPVFLINAATIRDIQKSLFYNEEYMRFKDGLAGLHDLFRRKT